MPVPSLFTVREKNQTLVLLIYSQLILLFVVLIFFTSINKKHVVFKAEVPQHLSVSNVDNFRLRGPISVNIFINEEKCLLKRPGIPKRDRGKYCVLKVLMRDSLGRMKTAKFQGGFSDDFLVATRASCEKYLLWRFEIFLILYGS